MSHINPLSTFKPYSPFGPGFKLFQAKVIENVDSKKLGRIKVYIPDLLPWKTAEKLPWIFPLYPPGLGESTVTTSFAVPEVDSYVVCIFPHNSIYQGFYAFTAVDIPNRMTDFDANYPKSYGKRDSIGNRIVINKDGSVNTIEITFSDESVFLQDSKDSKTSFVDSFGTSVQVDRKNQSFVKEFATTTLEVTPTEINLTTDAEITVTSTKKINVITTDEVDIYAAKKIKIATLDVFDLDAIKEILISSNIVTRVEKRFAGNLFLPLVGPAPIVLFGNNYLATDATQVTTFVGGVDGQIIYIVTTKSKKIVNGSGIFLQGAVDFDMVANDTLTLICSLGVIWYELARSVNT